MKMANFMRIVARLSLMFAILNFIFTAISNIMTGSLAFIWFCSVTFICSILVHKNRKLFISGIAAEFVPLIFAKNGPMFFMYASAAAYCIFYIFKDSKEINYGDFYEEFRRSLIFFGLILLLALVDIRAFNASPAFYILLYLIDSVMLMRLLRNMEFNKDNKYIMKQNIKYCTVFITAAFLLSLDIVREYSVKFLGLICTGLGYVAFVVAIVIGSVFYIFYLGAFYLLRWLAGTGGKKSYKTAQESNSSDFNDILKNIKGKTFIENLIQNKLVIDSLAVILAVITIVVFIKLFRKKTRSHYFGGDFIEEKEYITDEKPGNSKLNNIWLRLKPKNYAELIRYNYYKFLIFCEKLKIDINKGDTTFDVNKKAYGILDNPVLDSFRNIYIKARYSDKKIVKTEAEMSAEYYRKLKRQIK